MREIDELIDAAGAYKRWALEARKAYIDLRLRQDTEIRNLYIRTADRVAAELSKQQGKLRKKQLEEMEKQLRAEAERFTAELKAAINGHIQQAVSIGVGFNRTITLDLFKMDIVSPHGISSLYVKVNRQAVEACWARSHKGLFLSDRIWRQGENLQNTVRDIIQESVVLGQSTVKTAKMLEKYVRSDARTVAKDYPEMMKRLNVPQKLNYEAMRLARTEMTAAFGEGIISAARVSPSYKGLKWILSSSHPMEDVCDVRAAHDEGLGRGIYAPGNEPLYPAHPNCLCILTAMHEDPTEFVERLKRWQASSDSEPELQKWYNGVHQPGMLENRDSVPSNVEKPVKPKYYLGVAGLPEAAKVGLAQAWEEALDHGQKHGTETLLNFDAKTGKNLFGNLSGTNSQVQFTPELIEFLTKAPKDSILSIHNHPQSSSFSAEDLNVLSIFESIKYLSVIGHDKTRYLVHIGDGDRKSLSELKEAYKRYYDQYFDHYGQQVRNKALTSQEAWKEHSHSIITNMANEFGWKYSRILYGGIDEDG